MGCGFATSAVLSQNALKYHQGDLDHIVDELSEGEGDEEAGHAARLRLDMADDARRTNQIVTAVTEGRDAARKRSRNEEFGFMKLVGDTDRNKDDTEAANGEDDFEGLNEEEIDARILQRHGPATQRPRGEFSDSSSEDDYYVDDEDDAAVQDLYGESITILVGYCKAMRVIEKMSKCSAVYQLVDLDQLKLGSAHNRRYYD